VKRHRSEEKPLLKLYHHGSSACSAKVRLALAEKGLDWESIYVDILKGEQFREEFLAINPKAVVPVLLDGDVVIPESTVICEYIEEAFPANPIYPRAPARRAKVRLWTKAVDEELHPACSAITYAVSHRHTILRNGEQRFEDFLKGGAPEGATARGLKWQWVQLGLDAPGVPEKIRLYDHYLHKMESALMNSAWLAGDEFSMADIAMVPYVNRLAALSMDMIWRDGRLPKVEKWFDRVRSRRSFKPAMIDWVPGELMLEMRENGRKSEEQVRAILSKEGIQSRRESCSV
jgi:glutathione S-transferase